jgi:hypothetical protein
MCDAPDQSLRAEEPDHDPTVATMILNLAHAWQTDPTGALMALPLDRGTFDAAFRAARSKLPEILGTDTSRFTRDVYWFACSRHDPGPRRGTSRQTELVFVPFVAAGDLEPVTGDVATVPGFGEAFNASGYGNPDDFTVFFPRPVRAQWLLNREPGALYRILHGFTSTLLTPPNERSESYAVMREALATTFDPDGALPPQNGEPCIRALVGLHMSTVLLKHDIDRESHDPDRFTALLAERYPSLQIGPPGELIQTVGRMTVMDLVERWIRDAAEHGLTLALGADQDPPATWSERIGRIHVYRADTEIQILAEMQRTLLGPVAIEATLWNLAEPEILGALQAYTPHVVRHDRPFALPHRLGH